LEVLTHVVEEAELLAELLRHGLAFRIGIHRPALLLTLLRTGDEGAFAIFVLELVFAGVITTEDVRGAVGLDAGLRAFFAIAGAWAAAAITFMLFTITAWRL
jgi:hypothetical protein